MTSIAMSAGMLPSALGVGEGGSFRAPMAIAVIGGIIVSTVISLVVVPAFFLIMDDLSHLLGWLFGRLVGRKDEEMRVLENEELTEVVNDQTQTIHELQARLERLEGRSGKGGGSNVINHPALAAE